MTPLEKTLKRTLRINGRDYVVPLTPDALKITEKGHRLGLELQWADLISGESALAIALQASVGKLQSGSLPAASTPTPPVTPKRRPPAKHPRRSGRRSPLHKRSR
jgi:hypothetical protein